SIQVALRRSLSASMSVLTRFAIVVGVAIMLSSPVACVVCVSGNEARDKFTLRHTGGQGLPARPDCLADRPGPQLHLTYRSGFFAETPEPEYSDPFMDALSEVLRVIKTYSAIFPHRQ